MGLMSMASSLSLLPLVTWYQLRYCMWWSMISNALVWLIQYWPYFWDNRGSWDKNRDLQNKRGIM